MKWQGEWTLPRFLHDVHLVAIASGPGVEKLYWPIAKPYQPTSPKVNRRVIGASGAVWIDADGNEKRTSAHSYAAWLVHQHGHEAVAVQVASLLFPQAQSDVPQILWIDELGFVRRAELRKFTASEKVVYGPHIIRATYDVGSIGPWSQ